MFDIILIGYLSYRNGTRAKLKGQNAVLWGVVTALSCMFFWLVGFAVVIMNFCKNDINFAELSSMDIKAREAAAQQLLQALTSNPIHIITIEIFAIGGYLLVRYILDRKPDKKEPEIHWMDKIGEQ